MLRQYNDGSVTVNLRDSDRSKLLLDYVWTWTEVQLHNSKVSGFPIEGLISWKMQQPMCEWLLEHCGPQTSQIDETTTYFWYKKRPSPRYCTFYFRDPAVATLFKLVWG